ncbi:MAG: enoyl-CoA hydratase/isomerase family protein [Blastocatellia bacterium]|nr:enoyl-CoA hydratase/isomerase family protein [Blastocatellia bacterium]
MGYVKYEAIRYEVADAVATLTMNRPDKRNALNDTTLHELLDALEAAHADSTVRVVVLAGAGKDFCAGADLSALEKIASAGTLENLADVQSFVNLFIAMRQLPKPIVAKVQGRALAGGCGLATACDLIVSTQSAQFGYPEVKIGFIPAMVMAILRRNISEKRAFEWMAIGDPISAAEAQGYGLVNQVFADEGFETKVGEYVSTLASRSASALHLMKKLLYHMDGMSFETALRSGADLNVLCRTTADCQAGVAKFLKK